MDKVKIGARLALAFGLLVLMLMLMALAALGLAGRLQGNTEYYENHMIPSMKAIAEFYEGASDARRSTFLLVALNDAAEIRKIEERYAREVENSDKALASYEQQNLFYDEQDKALWSAAKSSLLAWKSEHGKVLELNRKRLGEPAAAEDARRALLGPARVANLALIKARNDWNAHNLALSKRVAERGRETYRSVVWTLALASLAAIGVAVAAAVAITRSVTRPLARALEVTRAVANGDLTQQVNSTASDELGELLGSLNHMSHSLSRMVRTVREGIETMATASAQIAQGNSDLSTRTEHQAANLQETAASMSEITGNVRSSSETARVASDLSGVTSAMATRGGDAVNEVVETMGRIQQASQKIAEITSVIDGIAFQTNILALNAAVEAARAGDQGRGFAVVAAEVRSLAQRSAVAAREIKGLITDSVERVEAGTRQVSDAGGTIQEVVGQVRKVAELIGDITRATAEQSHSVGSINLAVGQLDQSTQQNAALVEQTAAAAENLRRQAEKLNEAVSVFQVAAAA